jgi:hypothetical protein
LVAQVYGIWQSVFPSGQYSTAGLLADRLLDLAQREGSPASFGFAYRAQVDTNLFRGDLVNAEEHFARWSGFLDADGFREVPSAVVSAIGNASICAGALGRADKARERIAQAIAFARDSNNPFDLAVGRMLESVLFCLLREPQHADAAATQALAISDEHGFPFVRDVTRTALGRGRSSAARVKALR